MASRGASAGELQGLRNRIAAMARPPFQTAVAQLCANAALKKVADGFNQSRSQEGHPWAPLKTRLAKPLRRGFKGPRARGKPLLDTGRLRASFAVEPIEGGFRIGTAVGYAGYHQFGTRRGIPARPMLPVEGIPPSWTAAFVKEINGAVARGLRGAAL